MFRIKICGVTNPDDALAAVAAGADAIGLNFYAQSKRFVPAQRAEQVARGVTGKCKLVGVFVNMAVDEMDAVRSIAKLDAVQLHGDEPPGVIGQLRGTPVVRVRRVDDRGVAAIAEDLEACRAAGREPGAVLVDAAAPGQYGGTGETVSWAGLADHPSWLGGTPLILAGGLTPDNVAEAIRTVRPHGVDVASGVESAPGVKDLVKVRDFVQAASSALADA